MNERKGTRCLDGCFGIWSLSSLVPPEAARSGRWSCDRPLMDERCKGDAATATDDDVDVEICDKAEGFFLKKNDYVLAILVMSYEPVLVTDWLWSKLCGSEF